MFSNVQQNKVKRWFRATGNRRAVENNRRMVFAGERTDIFKGWRSSTLAREAIELISC